MAIPLSALTLFPATPEQVQESRTRSFVSWGRGVSLEQYLARDARSDKHEVAKNNRLVTWVLAPRDAPESLDFMCSCETFRRNGLLSKNSDMPSEDSEPEEVNCYGIASVFTPARNRGKGYAGHMMKLLHWVLAPSSYLPKEFPAEWGALPQRPSYITDGAFSVLYSDVGEKFYATCGPEPTKDGGWLVTRPISTQWDVAKSHELFSSSRKADLKHWKWLYEDLANDVWRADAKLMKAEIKSLSSPYPVGFAFLPTRGVAEFQHHRLQDFWEKMDPKPTHWGFYHQTDRNSAVCDASTFATWTLDVRSPAANNLIITRLRSQPELFEEVLFKIVDFAKKNRVEVVEVWNLETNLQEVAQRMGGATSSREEHLPSFKWYGVEAPKDVLWVYNEKFCWC